ncbi:MAG: chondroitinase family polysaccharide lyase [Agriterribacter sp.]
MMGFPIPSAQLLKKIINRFNTTHCFSKQWIFSFIFCIISFCVYCQPDFETSVPSNYDALKGTLSISDRHYRLGQKSLRWDWVAGDTLQIELSAAESDAINNGLFDWRNGHFELWVHNEVADKDTFEIKFLNTLGVDQFRFRFNVNYSGWRRLLRNYIYDMLKRNSTQDVDRTIYIVAPKNGSGTIYLDNMRYMRSYDFKQSDDVMPDMYELATTKNYIISDFYYKAYYAPPLISNPTPTATEIAGADLFKTRARVEGVGTAPTSTELSTANAKYDTYNISFSDGFIRGKVITDPADIGDMVSAFSRDYIHNGSTASRDKAINILKLLLDAGFSGGSGLWFGGGHLGYNQMKFFSGLINVEQFADASLKYELWHWIKWCTGTGLGWESDTNGQFDTDDIYTLRDAFLCMVLFSPDDASAVEDLKRFKAYIEKFLQNQKGTSDGIKVDGTAFHHNTHYSAYMYSMGSLCYYLLSKLRGTPFQINKTAYDNLLKAAYAESILCNLIYTANSLNGRHPFETITYYNEPAFKELSYIGGEVVNQAYDPIASGIHSRMYDYAEKVGGVGAESYPSGFWQMNYSPLAMYRRDNWAACIKGINSDFWATETYTTDNRYGRYQGYGALEILYPSVWPNKLTPSGMTTTGWDWNKVPGATSIVYPYDSLSLSATVSDLEERSLLNFAGGVKFGTPSEASASDVILKDFHGDYGIYGLNFQQSNLTITHSSTFVFRKSYFCFGRKIVCLGSNINNNRSWRNTITTLFQNTLTSPSTTVTVDGSAKTAFPFAQGLSNSSSHWIIDPFGTGYYVLNGSTIQVEKKSQTSPDESGSGATTTANYANAYIDHGTAPVNGKYAYVVVPKTTSAGMTQFASDMSSASTREFDILQQDAQAHIIQENATGVTGFSLFTANTNLTSNTLIKGNDVPCVTMVQVKNDTMRISLVNPDINIVNNVSVAVPITLTIYGGWIKASNIPAKYASLISTDSEKTLVTFTAADGLAAEITLARVSAVLPLRSLTLSGKIDASNDQNVLTVKFENDESETYYLEQKTENEADWKTINQQALPGAQGEQTYTFYHQDPVAATNLYRVKWQQYDGTWKYSNIVQLKNLISADIALAPNPAVNDFSIFLKEKPQHALKWSLTDAGGRTVKTGSIADVNEKIQVRELPAGVYYLNVDQLKNFRIVIMK